MKFYKHSMDKNQSKLTNTQKPGPKWDRHEVSNMTTLREEAQVWEAPRTLNIADLDKFSVDVELKDGSGKTSEGEEFSYKYATIDGKDYRVAGSVIGGIKALLVKMPGLKQVSVVKQGMGMNTRYQVIPFVETEFPIDNVQ